ncbi:MAG: sigma-70 family RNA polymerase sigma factor [Spirochaetota bacterium]
MVTKQAIIKDLSQIELNYLIENAKNGDNSSFQKILDIFKPLILSLVSKFSSNPSYKEDLIQEGVIGLYCAINKYDINKSENFGMYAYFWIKQAISRMADKSSSLIRIPIRKHQKLRKIKKEKSKNSEYSSIINYEFNFISIDDTGLNQDDHSLAEKIPSNDNPMSYIENKMNEEEFEYLLSLLTKRERDIIEKRYGLSSCIPLTLREIAHQYNLTSESIRKIELQALNKMKKAFETCLDL